MIASIWRWPCKPKTVMVSNDRRFVNAIASGPMKEYVAWLGEIH